MLMDWFKTRRKDKYVYLPKDKKWLFCFKKKKVIEHKDCDFYEHNLECEKNKDYWGLTHSPHTFAGYSYISCPDTILNECKYCLEQRQTVNKYRLSDEAIDWLDYWERKEKLRSNDV